MLPVSILSPHRDDAAFSLGAALSRWSKLNVPITVVNFFTISSYAPHSAATEIADISAVREREDRDALASIDPEIRLESLDLWDAPLRFNISVAGVSAQENGHLPPRAEIEALALAMHPYVARGLVLAPLALGDHIDHRAVRSAALSLPDSGRLGFYEDLPYATWTTDEQLLARVREIEDATGAPLEAIVVVSAEAIQQKLDLVSGYKSQITAAEAAAIAGHAARFGGGERIWIPKAHPVWRFLIQ